MGYGPPQEKNKGTYCLQLRLLADPGTVAETAVQDTVVVPRRSRLVAVKGICATLTSTPQFNVHSGVAADTTGRLITLVEFGGAQTATDGVIDETVDELAEDTVLSLRLVVGGAEDITGVDVTLELQPLDIT